MLGLKEKKKKKINENVAIVQLALPHMNISIACFCLNNQANALTKEICQKKCHQMAASYNNEACADYRRSRYYHDDIAKSSDKDTFQICPKQGPLKGRCHDAAYRIIFTSQLLISYLNK